MATSPSLPRKAKNKTLPRESSLLNRQGENIQTKILLLVEVIFWIKKSKQIIKIA